MNHQLSAQEIKRRLQELQNLKVSHVRTVKENKVLKEKVAKLEQENVSFKKEIEALKVVVAELKEIIFGKKKKKDEYDEDETDNNDTKAKKEPRSKKSYQREIPNSKDITERKRYSIDTCPDCKRKLRKKKIVIFYEEDIPLPTDDNKLKEVIEHQVEKGYCKHCKKWHSSIPLPSKKVIIGNKVKIYICYLSILMRLSFSQIQNILRNTFHFDISNGAIGNILHEMSKKWEIEFELIKEKLRNDKGVHLDETGWYGRWLWVMASVNTEDVLYLVANSRGKINAERLLGDHFHAVRVSDAYGAYKILVGICQLCWAHPFRYLRTLKNTKTLGKSVRKHCDKTFKEFSKIYDIIRQYLKEDFNPKKRKVQKQELRKLLQIFCKPNERDPKKLTNIKKLFLSRMDEYLTCMDYEEIPCDNNKAERKLRHFVIKRLISFGNKSDKGARSFEINASVLMTYWKKFKNNFFVKMWELSRIA